jgi:hypothetical protein
MKFAAPFCMFALCLLLASCSGGTGGSGGQSGSANGGLQITVTSLPTGYVGKGYSILTTAAGGSGSGYTWSVVSGNLPPGLTLPSSGTPSSYIAGVPTSTGSFSFTVQVQDSALNTATQAYVVQILVPQVAEFHTVPASGRILFVCECSGPMYGAGVATMRADLVACVQDLVITDEFDIVIFSDARPNYFEAMWGTPQPASPANISAATSWINGPTLYTTGMADYSAYASLEDSFATYTNIDRAFLFTYSEPTNSAQILADYGGWAATDPGRTQVVVSGHASSQTWGQQLATLAGGIFVP